MSCTGRYGSRFAFTAWATLTVAQSVLASPALSTASTADLKKLSVEELMAVPVYSASKRLEPTQSVPAAIFVLTGEDIRRAHATSIPEALRLVPGVDVGEVDANKWAVGIRGFNSRESNKLLVLIDGRSIYDPLFSGVLWESQDVMLEDIDRIEVIRGPGGALWGANAFNGIINIITRNARDSQGGLATLTAGGDRPYTAAGRYGWQTGDGQFARVYVKSYEHDEGFSPLAPAHDATHGTRGGFRWDWKNEAGDQARVSGEVFRAVAGTRDSLPPPSIFLSDVQDIEHRGGNFIARGSRHFSDRNELRLRFYYDRAVYDSTTYDQTRDTYDLELQQNLTPTARQQLVWGLGYRRLDDDTHVNFFGLISVEPPRRHDRIGTLFIQDTVALAPERVALTLGVKFEDTDYATPEWLPNVRLAFTPNAQRTWWAAASRAARVPSRLESDLTFHILGQSIRPGDAFESEHVTAWELGTRRIIGHDFSYDLATFYNDYTDLRTGEANGHLRNFMRGKTYGLELAARWSPLPSWRLDGSYSFLDAHFDLAPSSTSPAAATDVLAGLGPRHEASLRSAWDLPHDLEFDAILRYVDALHGLQYPAYTSADLGVTWHVTPRLDIEVAGHNLIDSPHAEQTFVFNSSGIPSQAERDVYGKITWSF